MDHQLYIIQVVSAAVSIRRDQIEHVNHLGGRSDFRLQIVYFANVILCTIQTEKYNITAHVATLCI